MADLPPERNAALNNRFVSRDAKFIHWRTLELIRLSNVGAFLEVEP